EKPWDASRYMYNAVQGKITFGEGLVIARDLWAARRINRVLEKETQLHDQTHPLDDPLAAFPSDDDLYTFLPDDTIDSGEDDEDNP
ncbi:hypothetical protein, partial [Streptomyces sp. NPDC002172]